MVVIGCNTYYNKTGSAFWNGGTPGAEKTPRYAVYSVFRPQSGWSPVHILRDESMPEEAYWRIACAQVTFSSEEDWILPCYFEHGPYIDYHGFSSPRFAVRTFQARLENDQFRILEWGNILTGTEGRGLVEPSVIRHGDRYFMTIRAEDGFGYWSVSDDGLNWSEPQPWRFRDGSMLQTDSTQQHFLEINHRLYLLYTQNVGYNCNIMRFRAPIFVAEIDSDSMFLDRAGESIALPLVEDDGITGLLGNFHALTLPDGRGVVSDGRLFLKNGNNGEPAERYSEVAISVFTD